MSTVHISVNRGCRNLRIVNGNIFYRSNNFCKRFHKYLSDVAVRQYPAVDFSVSGCHSFFLVKAVAEPLSADPARAIIAISQYSLDKLKSAVASFFLRVIQRISQAHSQCGCTCPLVRRSITEPDGRPVKKRYFIRRNRIREIGRL